jgi:hypothetical protein
MLSQVESWFVGTIVLMVLGGSAIPPATVQGASAGAAGFEESKSIRKLLEELETAGRTSGVKRIMSDPNGNVTGIFLYGATARDDNVRLLKELPKLRDLRISCPKGEISADALATLSQVTELRTLQLRAATRPFSIGDGEAVAKIRTLRSLRLSELAVAVGAIKPLARCRSLRSLTIEVTSTFANKNAAELAGITTLRELDLSNTNVSDPSLDTIGKLPNLKHLALQRYSFFRTAFNRERTAA